MEIDKEEFKKIINKQQKQTEHYIGSLKEDFDHKIDAVLEYVKDVPAIKEKQEIMFDKIGEVAENVTVIKESTKDHEQRIQRQEMKP